MFENENVSENGEWEIILKTNSLLVYNGRP
jgi:hypothetical protein